MANKILRAKVNFLLREGALPSLAADLRIYGGPGDGSLCDICDEEITPGEVQYDVEQRPPDRRRTLHLHLNCHQAWLESVRHDQVWAEMLLG